MCQIGREQSKAFSRLIKQIMLRRNNDVIAAYLPAKLDACIFCTLTDEQKELYMQARDPGLRHSTPRQLGPHTRSSPHRSYARDDVRTMARTPQPSRPSPRSRRSSTILRLRSVP